MTDVLNAKTSTVNDTDIPYSIRVKIKSIPHYRKCVESLWEHGFTFLSDDMDELSMRRDKRLIKKAYLYLGLNRTGYVFFAYSPVKYAKELTRKELISWLQSIAVSG